MSIAGNIIPLFAIGAWAAVAISRHKHGIVRTRKGERFIDPASDPNALPSPREAEMEAELTKLRERVKVLERIATEANSQSERQTRELAHEIESLRDK